MFSLAGARFMNHFVPVVLRDGSCVAVVQPLGCLPYVAGAAVLSRLVGLGVTLASQLVSLRWFGMRKFVVFGVVLAVFAATAAPVGAATGSVVINEIMYNPASDVDGHEFLELHNPGDTAVSLNGMSFTEGIGGTFGDVTLGAGEYVIVSPSSTTSQSVYGVAAVLEYTGKIGNGGETVTLTAADGVTVVDSVTYTDDPPWPLSPDGDGPSLELINPLFDNDVAASWAASTTPTPGAQNSIYGDAPAVPGPEPADPSMVINELHYNPVDGFPEFLELFNATDEAIDLSLWELDGVGSTIPDCTIVEPNGYIVFTDDLALFLSLNDPGSDYLVIEYLGGLKGGGELIELRTPDGTVIDSVDYDDSSPWEPRPHFGIYFLELDNLALITAWPNRGMPRSLNRAHRVQPTVMVRNRPSLA